MKDEIEVEMAAIIERVKQEPEWNPAEELARLRFLSQRLAHGILALDMGLPTVNDEYPDGMCAVDAALYGLAKYKALKELFDVRREHLGA